MKVRELVRILQSETPQFVHEAELQEALRLVLAEHGVTAERERRLTDGRSRIDLFVEPGVGVEVKIDGSWADVTRQLIRYAKCVEITELVLVTTRSKHHHIPSVLEGKPVHLVSLIGAAL